MIKSQPQFFRSEFTEVWYLVSVKIGGTRHLLFPIVVVCTFLSGTLTKFHFEHEGQLYTDCYDRQVVHEINPCCNDIFHAITNIHRHHTCETDLLI